MRLRGMIQRQWDELDVAIEEIHRRHGEEWGPAEGCGGRERRRGQCVLDVAAVTSSRAGVVFGLSCPSDSLILSLLPLGQHLSTAQLVNP